MRKQYFIGGGILLVVIIYLLYLSFGSSASYYVTVSEFFAKGTELYDTNIRIAGKIADTPIDWNAEDLELKFTITEGGKNMPVMYNGAQPGGFQAGSDILVEGNYSSDGIFQASQLIMKCPSKYEIKE
jgi:cytochrome c-type biogenesis protein CcmE